MALTAFLTLKLGGNSVQGSSRFKDHEGALLVIGMSHEIGTNRDEHGMPTGSPKHRTLFVQKDIDIASPILHQAFRDNLAFDQFVLEFTRFPPAGGGQEIHATIGLTKPRIASIRAVMPNLRKPDNAPIPEYEEIGFTYEQIAWKWHGKGDGSGEAQFIEEDADFSKDSTSWVEELEAKMLAAMENAAVKAGEAAKEALKQAFVKSLQDTPK